MSSTNDANMAIISALNSIVTQNRYAALQFIRLIYNYDSSMTKAIIEIFGIPVAQQKQVFRAKLESLRQGNIPSRQFKATFQSIVQELPEGATIPMGVLRSLYLGVMNPRLMEKIIGRVSTDSTWVSVANEAIAIDEILNADPRLANAYLYSPESTMDVFHPPQQVQATAQVPGPVPMEIDAFHYRSPNYHKNQTSSNDKSKKKFNQ
ncbi:unnamed protein product [Mucor hiemalis]